MTFGGLLALYFVLDSGMLGEGAVQLGSNHSATKYEEAQHAVRYYVDGAPSIPAGIVGGANAKAHFPNDIFADFRLTGAQDKITAVHLLSTQDDCRFTPPNPGDRLVNIHVGKSEMNTLLYSEPQEQIVSHAMAYVEWHYKHKGDSDRSRDVDEFVNPSTMQAIDVAITDTSAPLHLVLQNAWEGMVWNLHLAPGVEISRIAVISTGPAAVADTGRDMPIEAVDVTQVDGCVVPARDPDATPEQLTDVGRTSIEMGLGDLVRERQDERKQAAMVAYRSYTGWFRDQFGVFSETDVIGYGTASHILVGPVPASEEERVPFVPLDGRSVHATPNTLVFAAESKKALKAYVAGVVETLLVEAIGDTPERLFPVAMEAGQ